MGLICQKQYDESMGKMGIRTGEATKVFNELIDALRVFSSIVGMSPAEYIRNRRLTCAADELTRSNANILDIAIKYYFGSNESFTRAFTKFHGISPKMAKKRGTELKAFSKINLSLKINGGSIMDYRIEKKDKFRISAIVKDFNLQTSKQKIPEFWTEIKENGKLMEISKNSTKMVMGICLGENSVEDFRYGIGAENLQRIFCYI